MANPWLKKNPFLSMWLSAVHRSAGVLRGQALAQARQQTRKPASATAAGAAAPPKTQRGRKG